MIDAKRYEKVLVDAFTARYAEGSDVWSQDASLDAAAELAVCVGRGNFPGGVRMLDIGCGKGRQLGLLAERIVGYTGVDLLAHAEWQAVPSCVVPGRFVADDFRAWARTSEERFELALDHGCFHHQHPDVQCEYLDLVRSLLVPGGLLSLVVWAEPFSESDADGHGRFHWHFARSDLQMILNRHGLQTLVAMNRTARIGIEQWQVIARRV